MNIIKSKKIILLPILLALLLGIFLTISLKSPKATDQKPVETSQVKDKKQSESIEIDFNGDGINEILNVNEGNDNTVNMVVLDSKGNKLAELLNELFLYPTSLYKIIRLNENSQKQYLQWDMATGPHQIETVFLTVVGSKILPIYSLDLEKKTMYSPFYTSRGMVTVEDANNDGLKEVIENIDEYPVNAPRLDDPDMEKMIRNEFSKSGFSEDIIKSNIAIVARENSGKGRGKKVIMAIHSFVDGEKPYFKKLSEDEYEKIAGPLIKASIEIAKTQQTSDSLMRYNELEQDSKDFSAFVRYFWTHGRPFEIPIPEDKAN